MPKPLEEEVLRILEEYLSPIISQSILRLAVTRSGSDLRRLKKKERDQLLREIGAGVSLYVADSASKKQCIERVGGLIGKHVGEKWHCGLYNFRKIKIETEDDIIAAREIGKEMCASNGFRLVGQIKLATAISELARNIVQYAGTGELRLSLLNIGGRFGIEIVAEDHGPGIENVETILEGKYRSGTGLGKGLAGTKNLADEFDIETSRTNGTCVTLRMYAS